MSLKIFCLVYLLNYKTLFEIYDPSKQWHILKNKKAMWLNIEELRNVKILPNECELHFITSVILKK